MERNPWKKILEASGEKPEGIAEGIPVGTAGRFAEGIPGGVPGGISGKFPEESLQEFQEESLAKFPEEFLKKSLLRGSTSSGFQPFPVRAPLLDFPRSHSPLHRTVSKQSSMGQNHTTLLINDLIFSHRQAEKIVFFNLKINAKLEPA